MFLCLVEPKFVRLHDVVSGSVSIAANVWQYEMYEIKSGILSRYTTLN